VSAACFLSPDGERREHSALAPGHGCNNEAELHALCLAIDLAVAAGRAPIICAATAIVAVRYVTGVDSTAVARLLPLIARAREGLAQFDDAHLLWVPRHRNATPTACRARRWGWPPASRPSLPGGAAAEPPLRESGAFGYDPHALKWTS
jgi:ribonuclease HI